MSTTAKHFSPRTSLAALGLRLRRLGLLDAIAAHVHVPQKTVKHTPAEKLYDAFVAILAGAHGLSEINTRLRADPTLQRSFGRPTCAEYSLVQDTLDACTEENVAQLRRVVTSLFREHSCAARHDYSASLQVLDLDMTGLPCGSKADLSVKGYFSKEGIRCGRQLGRVVSGATEEIVADLLFAGNVQLNTALRSLVASAEEVLLLDRWRRSRTVLRMDSGGGSLPDVNWCLARGYQLHCKDISSTRAAVWAATVAEWFDDPAHPERQVGWVVPEDTPDYARPVRRLAIRWRKRNRQIGHDLLISTLTPAEVLTLLGRPEREASEPELVALAYAQLYDQRAGAIEVEIREDKQGVGINRRRKKRAAAQAMLTLLGTLAHNVLVWARAWLAEVEPRLKQYGIVRLLRDVLCVSGFVETDRSGLAVGVVLNRGSTLARLLAGSLRELLGEQAVTVSLGDLSD
jgi:Transposase DDE domain group 1